MKAQRAPETTITRKNKMRMLEAVVLNQLLTSLDSQIQKAKMKIVKMTKMAKETGRMKIQIVIKIDY
jgi:hypothetical protein